MTELAAPRFRRRPEARRDEILDAAQRLFTRDGLAQTTVAEIATGAGVAKGSVYRYFRNKDALLSALKDRFFEQMMQRITATVASMPGVGFAEIADAAIESTARFLFEEAALVELWCREAPDGTDEFSRGMTRMASAYEAAIAGGVAAGTLECADPRSTALLLVYAVEGVATHAILHRGSPSADEIVAAAQAMTRKALGLPATDQAAPRR